MSTMGNKFSLLYTTSDSEENLILISKKLLEKDLIACANIFPIGKSIYKWQGEIQEANEFFMLLKSTSENFGKVEALINEYHSYDCPALLEIDIKQASTAFTDFLNQSISK